MSSRYCYSRRLPESLVLKALPGVHFMLFVQYDKSHDSTKSRTISTNRSGLSF